MAHGGIMADMVYNALRRKLAAAEAAGDVDRAKRLREMMRPLAKMPEEVPEEPPVTEAVNPLLLGEIEPDVEITEEPEE